MNVLRTVLLSSLFMAPALMPVAAIAQDAGAGEKLFRTRCGSCHSIEPGQNRIGPTLSGLMGRQAGSVEGARYSKGMRDLGITWDTTHLATFLANPREMVVGTTMTVAVPSAADRAAIVAYLQQATATTTN